MGLGTFLGRVIIAIGTFVEAPEQLVAYDNHHSEHGHARKRASRRPAAAAAAAEAAARAMPTLPTYTQPAAPSAAALEHMQQPETTKTRLKQ